MTAIITFLILILALNSIPFLIRKPFPKVEKVVIRTLITTTILFLTFGIFEEYGYSLKGKHTFEIITGTCVLSIIAFFVLIKNTLKKIVAVFLLTLLLAVCSAILFLGKHVYESQLDENIKIQVKISGFLACGEMLSFTQTRFVIFDKEEIHSGDLCIEGITKIETVGMDDKHIELLLYHNGEMDSENPYSYVVERNGW